MKMKTINIVNQLCSYFGFQIIGSWLLVEKGLDKNLVRDIDIILKTNDIRIYNIREFLRDNGFKETKHEQDERGYQFVQGSLIFVNSDYDKPIHICLVNHIVKIYSIGKIIGSKYNRHNESDVLQLNNFFKSY